MTKNSKKQLLENFLSLGALQAVSYIIPLITLPYLSRVLSVDKFGLVFFAFAFIQYFTIITDFGFDLSATREIAINIHNKSNLSNIFNSVISIKFILLLICFCILCILSIFVPKIQENILVFFLSFILVVGNVLYPTWFFQGMEHMKYITFLNILSKTIFLILIFIFVKEQNDYIIVPLLNSLGFLVSGILGFIIAIKRFNIKLYIPKISSIKKQFKYSSEFFISRVSASIYTNTNTFFLGMIGSNSMVGYYVAAEKIYQGINALKTPLNSALYPYVAKNRDIKLFKKIFIIAIIIIAIILSTIFVFSKNVIAAFYGMEMINAHNVLKIFCFVALINIPSVLLGYPLLGALGYTKEANFSVVISSIIHIIGLFILYLLGFINIYTVAFMVLITTSIEFFIRLYFVIKHQLWNYRKEEI